MSHYDQVKAEHTRSIEEVRRLVSIEKELFSIYSQMEKSESRQPYRGLVVSASTQLFSYLRDSVAFLLPSIVQDAEQDRAEIYLNSNRHPMIGFIRQGDSVDVEISLASAVLPRQGPDRYAPRLNILDCPLVASLDIRTSRSSDAGLPWFETRVVLTPYKLITTIVRLGEWISCAPSISYRHDLFGWLHWQNSVRPFFESPGVELYVSADAWQQMEASGIFKGESELISELTNEEIAGISALGRLARPTSGG